MTTPRRPSPDEDHALEREPTATEQAALQWVVRSTSGLDAAEARECAAWLAADPRHRELFEEFGGTWSLMRQAPLPAPLTAVAPRDASNRAGRGAKIVMWSFAAAAAVALTFVTLTRPTVDDGAVATEVGRSRQLKLSDGSAVRLNTDSAVVTTFSPAERRIRLDKGEAYFEVAKNPQRPFIVEAAGVAVRAVGTAFNVRLRGDAVEVLVTEGRVRVATGGVDVTEVGAGERARVPLAGPAANPAQSVASDEVARLLAWQGGRLDFSDTPLGEMVAEFNRYNQHKLAIADPALAAVRFGGSFRPDDRVGFVRVLRENFGVQAEERGDETLLRAAP